MAKFNSACFLLIAELLFILDQANAKGRGGGRGRGGGYSGYSDGLMESQDFLDLKYS